MDEVSFPLLFSPPLSDSVELSRIILPSFSGDSAITEGLSITLSLSVTIGLYLDGKVLGDAPLLPSLISLSFFCLSFSKIIEARK